MKKISAIILAMVMVMTLSQCKKNEPNTTADKGVAITLNVIDDNNNSNSNSRVEVNTTTGTVDFENNDQILVASGGKYVGTLTYNGELFTGSVYDAVAGYPLSFYFLGNITPAETLTYGETQSCSVVITDQTQHLPVVSYAPSNENYGTTTDFTSHLLNKCALVKFNVTSGSEAATCITGFNNKVTVNFSESTLTPSQEGNGVITLPAGTGERWAILLPQAALAAGGAGSAYSADNAYTGTRGAVPAIGYNAFLTAGIPVMLEAGGSGGGNAPVGAINGLFTINANGNQVYFSQGNLQYRASTHTWRFAENQWDYVGTQNPNVGISGGTITGSDNTNISSTYSGWIDLFGWATSGSSRNTYYRPWDTQNNGKPNKGYGYGPVSANGNGYQNSLIGIYADSDWGVRNAISNGGGQSGQWRTPTRAEWVYVFNTRTTTSGIRYAKAQVNEVNGVILLPDNWDTLYYVLNNTNASDGSFDDNVIETWSVLEQHGAVFLPAAGLRAGTSVGNVSTSGLYWSTSYYDSGNAYNVTFRDSYLNPQNSSGMRYMGRSVRLIRNAQ